MKKVLIVVLTLMIPTTSLGDCKATPVLCDRIIQESKVIIKEQDAQINDYKTQSSLQRQILADKDRQLASPLRDPVKVALGTTVVLLLTGLLTGHIK